MTIVVGQRLWPFLLCPAPRNRSQSFRPLRATACPGRAVVAGAAAAVVAVVAAAANVSALAVFIVISVVNTKQY